MTSGDPPLIEFITRANCSLCEVGKADLERWARRVGLGITVIGADSDAALYEQFGLRVPVVRTAQGRVLAEGRWSSARLGAALVGHRLASLLRRG